MNELPGWIQLLYKRQNAYHALHTAFLHESAKSDIAELADGQPNGRQQLRETALSYLLSSDPAVVALSLVFLSVVGEAQDTAHATNLLNHPSELVQRAARACLFALEHLSSA